MSDSARTLVVRDPHDLNFLTDVDIIHYPNGDYLVLRCMERIGTFDRKNRLVYYHLYYGRIVSGKWMDRVEVVSSEFFGDLSLAKKAFETRKLAQDSGCAASGLSPYGTLNDLLKDFA